MVLRPAVPIGLGPLGSGEADHLALEPPAGAVAAAVTVTSTEATAPTSYVSVYPADAADPFWGTGTSVLNAYAGDDVPNLAVVPLGDDDAITLYNDQGTTHLIVDVVGWFVLDGGAEYMPLATERAAQSPVRGPGSYETYSAASSGLSVPSWATALALNLTTAGVDTPSYLTVYPSAAAQPFTSNANARPGADVAAAAFTGIDPGFTVYNNAGSLLLYVDVQGYFAEIVG